MPLILISRDNLSSRLPAALVDAAPYCAQNCIASYIRQDFSCSASDLQCLCSNYSKNGYTLGEFSYGCLQTSCSEPSEQLQAQLYRICQSQSSAVTPTHSPLTLPPLTTASITTTSSALPTSSVASITSASFTTSAAASSASASHSTELTTAQATGISVGAFAVLLIAGSIVFLILWLRRRRDRRLQPRHGSYDFVDKDPQKRYPFNTSGLVDGRARERVDLAIAARTQWYAQEKPEKATVRQVEPQSHKSRRSSNESTRTVSQLLPDKPWPSPPRLSSETARHIAERPSADIVKPPAVYHGLPREGSPKQPSLSLDIPRAATRYLTTRPQQDVLPSIAIDRTRALQAHPSGQTYGQPEPRSPDSPTPIEEEEQKRKAVPASIKVPYPVCPERAVRDSNGSDTSFESDFDDATPPELHHKSLVTSPEEPYKHVTRSPVDYPKIPRPSNQAVARIIPIHTPERAMPQRTHAQPPRAITVQPPDSQQYYQAMQDQGSPVKMQGRPTQGGLPSHPRQNRRQPPAQLALRSTDSPYIKSQDVAVKSPMWTPKLTPTRRGEDLYLSVNLASPGFAPEGWPSRR